MKQQMIVGLVVGAVLVTAIGAVAGYRMIEDDQKYAEVIDVEPAYKSVTVPGEACHDEVVERARPTRDPEQIAGTIAGAVVGGVVGSQVGEGNGKKLATVGGAVAGGYAGNKIQEGMQERNTYQDSQRVCETTHKAMRQRDGFDVTYRLNGRQDVIRLDYDPGDRIPVDNGELMVRR